MGKQYNVQQNGDHCSRCQTPLPKLGVRFWLIHYSTGSQAYVCFNCLNEQEMKMVAKINTEPITIGEIYCE